jgi:flavodoxin
VSTAQPKVLIVYFTLSQQTGRVVDAMADAGRAKGWDITTAKIEFTDPKWTKRIKAPPMKWAAARIGTILFAQRSKRTGPIGIPAEAAGGDYDLVLIGSPTWWLTTNMPIRSYLKSPEAKKVMDGKPFAAASVSRRYWKGNIKDVRELGEANGGRWVDQTHFLAEGGQVKTMMSWLAFYKYGEARERSFGLKMPPPNLQSNYPDQARDFIDTVHERVFGQQQSDLV